MSGMYMKYSTSSWITTIAEIKTIKPTNIGNDTRANLSRLFSSRMLLIVLQTYVTFRLLPELFRTVAIAFAFLGFTID